MPGTSQNACPDLRNAATAIPLALAPAPTYPENDEALFSGTELFPFRLRPASALFERTASPGAPRLQLLETWAGAARLDRTWVMDLAAVIDHIATFN